jgi:hypothetical protein
MTKEKSIMKPLLIALLVLPLLMGCYYGQRNATLQIADASYLQFTGNTEDAKVVVDTTSSFVLEKSVNSQTFKPQKKYSLQAGKHRIQIYKGETIVLDQLIYIGNNETKEFIVP